VILAVGFEVPPNSWVVESVATMPKFRGLGLVDRLLDEVLSRGRAAGCANAVIDTVLIGNEPALRACRKHGFTAVDQRRDERWQQIFGSPGVEVLNRPL
jgi:ribosomal protein S18 acetylase RimI-like enzyme